MHGSAPCFPLVDRYHGIRMGFDLAALEPGALAVVESARWLQREQGYGYLRALWWLWLEDGRRAMSVPPGTAAAIGSVAREVRSPDDMFRPEIADRLRRIVDAALHDAGIGPSDRTLTDLCFACNAALLRPHPGAECRRLTDDAIPPADGLRLPTHCFPGGIVYGVVADGTVASVAFCHRTGVMEDRVADIGVETAPAYRRRGFATAAVAAAAGHVIRAGGEARYGCRPDNTASVATARSVGFVPYGNSLVLAAPA